MIRIKGLKKTFGKTTVLDNINLVIEQGERVALIGPNGAGKTTLIRTILGEYSFEGELAVFGKNPRSQRVHILERIGYVPQMPPPIQMTVGELVDFTTAISRNCHQQTIYHHAEELGLDVKSNIKKPFQKLSGGMKQKILISLVLGRKPDILIMDEPAANLDPQARQIFFMQLMREMEHTTMLLSSHRVDEIVNLISRVVEMDYGKIVSDEQIEPSELTNKVIECRIVLSERYEPAIKLLKDWKFENVNGGLEFIGRFIGTERFRFLAAISHFAGRIEKLDMG